MKYLTGSQHRRDEKATIHDVMRVVVHVDYNKATAFAADIAIVFLEYAIAFGKKAKKAILVRTSSWRKKSERDFYVTGWGMIRVSKVMQLDAILTQALFICLVACLSQ